MFFRWNNANITMEREIQYSDWQQKLKGELKIEDLNNKIISLRNGIKYDPFLDPQSLILNDNKITIPESFSIGVSLTKHNNDKEINQNLLHLLANNLRLIKLHANETTDWSVLLNEIYMELIHLDIEFETETALNRFLDYKKGIPASSNWKFSLSVIGSHFVSRGEGVFKILDLANQGTEYQIGCLMAIKDLFSSSEEDHIIRISMTDRLLEIVPFIRAIKILQSKYKKGGNVLLESILNLESSSSSKEDQLIMATNASLWAKSAGVDHLYFNDVDIRQELNHSRLLINIQNLFELESAMDIKIDPYRGAYIIEDLTQKLLEKTGE